MHSQLTDANISGIIDIGDWVADFVYSDAGNMTSRTIQSSSEGFTYTGHQMTDADGNGLAWDENGQLLTGVDVNLVWNWDGMLREANTPAKSISLRYDPSGNRIFKDSSQTGQRKYIVDIVGDLPVILMELDPDNDMHIERTYIYANSQIMAQHLGDHTASRYFYLHDRLGSVRQVVATGGGAVRLYTYSPFGEVIESTGIVKNDFKFTGQYHDSETGQYYLRARMYDPYISRFNSRDLLVGEFEQPLTLHRYLYCRNDPTNLTDPTGEWAALRTGGYTFTASVGPLGGEVAITPFFFYGLSDDLTFFCGYLWFVGGGIDFIPDPVSLSLMFSVGWSPNAQRPEDLAGDYKEWGGYAGSGFAAGYSYAENPRTGVTLHMWSAGIGSGGDVHRYWGKARVFNTLTIGP
jgi:RHS repeat-associated protein